MSTSLLKNIANENEPYAAESNLLKIFVPKDTIGVYVNAVTKRSEEEMLLFPNMFFGLISYPYKDQNTKKKFLSANRLNYISKKYCNKIAYSKPNYQKRFFLLKALCFIRFV